MRHVAALGGGAPVDDELLGEVVNIVVAIPLAVAEGHDLTEAVNQILVAARRPLPPHLPEQARARAVGVLRRRRRQIVPEVRL